MKNLKNYLYQSILFILFIVFISKISLANNVKNSAVVFMYHKFGVSKYPSTNITIEQFNKHLEEFSKTKYNILPLDYIIDTIINDGNLPQNNLT